MEKIAKYETQLKNLKKEIFRAEEEITTLEINFNNRFIKPVKKLYDEFEWRKTAIKIDLQLCATAKTPEKKEELTKNIFEINKRSQELKNEILKYDAKTKEERKEARKEIKDKKNKKEELEEELRELAADYFGALEAKFDLNYCGPADVLLEFDMYADESKNAIFYVKLDKYRDIVDITTSII